MQRKVFEAEKGLRGLQITQVAFIFKVSVFYKTSLTVSNHGQNYLEKLETPFDGPATSLTYRMYGIEGALPR